MKEIIRIKPRQIKNITNQIFGSLTAISFNHKDEKGNVYWNYKCICGKIHTARANTIKYTANKATNKMFPSCGCKELEQKTKHGFRKKNNTHPLYRAYRGIMSRCYDENNKQYHLYGKLGTTISDEWKNNPQFFIKWCLENGWKKDLHIDKDILCEQLNIEPKIYAPNTLSFISSKENCSFGNHRDVTTKNSCILKGEIRKNVINDYIMQSKKNMSQLAKKYNVAMPTIRTLLIQDNIINGNTYERKIKQWKKEK